MDGARSLAWRVQDQDNPNPDRNRRVLVPGYLKHQATEYVGGLTSTIAVQDTCNHIHTTFCFHGDSLNPEP